MLYRFVEFAVFAVCLEFGSRNVHAAAIHRLMMVSVDSGRRNCEHSGIGCGFEKELTSGASRAGDRCRNCVISRQNHEFEYFHTKMQRYINRRNLHE